MRKFFFSILLLISFEENAYTQIRIGTKAGLLYSGVSYPGGNVGGDASTYIISNYIERHAAYSYMGGLMADLRIGKLFTLRPNLFYKPKKWNDEKFSLLDDGTIRFESDEIYEINYIEMPVNFIYSSPLGNGKLYIGTGPYFSYALSGKYLRKNNRNGRYTEFDIQFENDASMPDNKNVHRIDYGLSSVVGYEFIFGLVIDVGYDLGMGKIFLNPHKITDPTSRFNVFSLSAGYFINLQRR